MPGVSKIYHSSVLPGAFSACLSVPKGLVPATEPLIGPLGRRQPAAVSSACAASHRTFTLWV